MPWNRIFVLQELDDQIDELSEQLRLASRLSDGRTVHLDEESARARRQADASEAQLKKREEERAEAAASLPREVIADYERARRRLKSPPWVVNVFGSACRACNIVLPSKLIGDARRTGQPFPCPSCGRLLIWKKAAHEGPKSVE